MGDLIKRLPTIYKQGENQRLLEAIEKHRVETEKRIDSLRYTWDPERCPPEQLDVKLRLLGWNAQLDLTERQKRKLVKAVTTIQRQSGTGPGMINALRFILGVEVSIREYLKIRYGFDGTTFPAGDHKNYSFDVVFPLRSRAEDITLSKSLIEYMMPPNTYYIPIQLQQISNTKTKNQSVTISVNNRFSRNVYDPLGIEQSNLQPLKFDGTWRWDGSFYLWGDKSAPPDRKSEARHTVSIMVKDKAGNILRKGAV